MGPLRWSRDFRSKRGCRCRRGSVFRGGWPVWTWLCKINRSKAVRKSHAGEPIGADCGIGDHVHGVVVAGVELD